MYITFYLLFLLNVATSSGSKYSTLMLDLPFEKTHDHDSEICCNGVIHKRPSDHHKCCLTTIYDNRTQDCCNGQPYDPQTQTCCKSVDKYSDGNEASKYLRDMKPISGNGDKYCCGNKIVNKKESYCCKGTLYESKIDFISCIKTILCQGKYINPLKEMCCKGITVKLEDVSNFKCCGSTSYDTRKNVCCKGLVVSKGNDGDNSCCNGKPFNSTTQICCQNTNEVVKKSGDHSKCCGGVTYSSRKRPQRPPRPPQQPQQPQQQQQRCCRGVLYNPTDEICCNGIIISRKTHFCCRGVVYEIGCGVCCGEKFYPVENATTRDCCGTELLSKDDVGTVKEKCCSSEKQQYDPNCCGFKALNLSTEYCCGGKIVPKLEGNQIGCCSVTVNSNRLKYF